MILLDFKKVLPEVEKAISQADFIAVDGEFTGETPASYFSKPLVVTIIIIYPGNKWNIKQYLINRH